MKNFIVFILCFVTGAFTLAGCSNNYGSDFDEKNYISDSANLSGVCIDVRDREIEVSPSEDNKVHINYFESIKEYYNISVSDDNVLSMTAASSKKTADYIGVKPAEKNRKIYLQLPDNLLKSLSLSTTNENISIFPLTLIDSVSISANGGNINFDKINVGKKFDAESKNGNIYGTLIGSYDDYAIDCRIKKGQSNLPQKKADGEKILNVSNNNGDININFVQY